MHVSENPVTNKFAPVEPPPKMSPTEEAELNRPLEGTPEVWPPRGSYEPVSGPMERPPMDGDMCEDEAHAPLEEERSSSPAAKMPP